jgi:hypothetical protein
MTAPNMEAPSTAEGFAGRAQEEQQHRDSADTAPDAQTAEHEKTFARLQADAAMVRCALCPLASGSYMLTRTGWGLSRELPSLAAVQTLLRQMTGPM